MTGFFGDLVFLVGIGLLVLVMVTYWVKWVGLFARPPRLEENLGRLGPAIPLLFFWALFLDLRHTSVPSLIPVAAIVLGLLVLLMIAYTIYLRRPGADERKRRRCSADVGHDRTLTHRSNLLLTRQFFRLTSRFSGGIDDYGADIPDASELSHSSMATRVSLELGLMIRWAGTAIAIAAVMVAVGYIAHLSSKQAEHYAFYVFVALVAFSLAGMFLNTLRYIVAWLTTYRADMRERAGRPDADQADSSVMYWLTTPRDSDFIVQFLVAGLVIASVASNGA